jgi:hypothetical protein
LTRSAPSAETTLFVILGASEFPLAELTPSPAFLNSANALGEYLLDSDGFGLPTENLLSLFDTTEAPSDLLGKIGDFLARSADRPEERRARDLVVYYVGHGGFSDDNEYFLAIRATRKDGKWFTSIQIKALAQTLKEHGRHLRKYLILDCCFSAAAYTAFQSGPLPAALQKTKGEFEGLEAPGRGTALLCASGPRDPAKAPPGEKFTMFSGALVELLKGPQDQPKLSLLNLRDFSYGIIKERWRDEAVRPELHSPEQVDGDIARLPLFPILARRGSRAVPGESELRRALDPGTFEPSTRAMQCVVVTAERRVEDVTFPLEEHVRRACDHHGSDIHKAVVKYKTTDKVGSSPTEEKAKSPGFRVLLSTLPIADAFRSEESLKRSVEAMCKADVVVFDVTDFQPGAMLLLGVRSVARRGVTICSLGANYVIGAELTIPFNLQMLNLAAHSEAQEEKGPDPLHLIGQKIANGFRELAQLPHYLDLPAYDAVRRLGIESAAYRPVQYHEQVLILCPFSEAYTRRNWNRYLSKELPGKLKTHISQTSDERDEVAAVDRVEPQLVRLLDLKTPRLVAQTLYESIRLTEMCVVDWTNLRANVMYETGVRLATNPLGAVHIVEETAPGPVQKSATTPSHATDMMKLFSPITYRCQPGATAAYEKMIETFEARLKPETRSVDRLIYETVGTSVDRAAQPVAVPVVEELVRSANLLASDDDESTGISPILYHDVNKDIAREAKGAAAERRLAAWLYIDGRYQDAEIRENAYLYEQYRKLGAGVRRWLKKQRNASLDEHIRKRMSEVKGTNGKKADEGAS